MRSIIITSLQPPSTSLAQHGTYKRIKLYGNALWKAGVNLEIVFSVTDADVTPVVDLRQAERDHTPAETAYWGAPVTPHFVRRRQRTQSFRNEYIDGIFASAEQPPLYRWAGPDQAEAVGR